MLGTGKGAENGMLIKSAESLELAHKLQTIVFDKTGTITEGKPTVTDYHTVFYADYNADYNAARVAVRDTGNNAESELLRLAAAVERNSEHPLAVAVVRYAQSQNIDLNIDRRQRRTRDSMRSLSTDWYSTLDVVTGN
jgi:P-type Cu+ transporter